uniref:Uncharacterized protein n=1 Tax=Arundo donax TaxID=35708 RepID=A0A0A9CG03_ARUDO
MCSILCFFLVYLVNKYVLNLNLLSSFPICLCMGRETSFPLCIFLCC